MKCAGCGIEADFYPVIGTDAVTGAVTQVWHIGCAPRWGWQVAAGIAPSTVHGAKPKAAPLDDVGNDSGDTEKNEVK